MCIRKSFFWSSVQILNFRMSCEYGPWTFLPLGSGGRREKCKTTVYWTIYWNILHVLPCSVRGSSGEILINGENRRSIGLEEFKKVSCYIQQQDVVRPLLRVSEAMSLATHLKLGCSVSAKAKHQKVSWSADCSLRDVINHENMSLNKIVKNKSRNSLFHFLNLFWIAQ